ncbi:MAG: GNAT family N-acetyltransferase [Tatlockia sp.]|nr:GNAT family N-acetyltransferase [Tatlockia sp.]
MGIFLETKRLILKTAEISDLEMLVALRSDFEVMENTGYGGTQTKEEVREYLDFAISYQKKQGMGFCLVFERESTHFIGEAGLFHLLFDDAQPEIELGYHLHKKFWGKGYGTELVKALIHWGFQHLSINRLVSTTYPDNVASQKVLKKAGFDYSSKKQLANGQELLWYEIYKKDYIELETYDSQWPQLAAREIKKPGEPLPPNHTIDNQPIDSTANPGMVAKPEVLFKAEATSDAADPVIVFLTGASGAGKTTILEALNKQLSASIVCLHFDDIGVPTEQEMISIYGSGSEWQKAMTYRWIKNLLKDYQNKKLVILEGQVNLDFIVSAFEEFNFHQYKIVLAHCDNITRHKRLQQDRNQPELINDNMDTWADFLKKQAIAKKAMILDTTFMNLDEMVCQFGKLIDIEEFIGSQ